MVIEKHDLYKWQEILLVIGRSISYNWWRCKATYFCIVRWWWDIYKGIKSWRETRRTQITCE